MLGPGTCGSVWKLVNIRRYQCSLCWDFINSANKIDSLNRQQTGVELLTSAAGSWHPLAWPVWTPTWVVGVESDMFG